MIKAFKLIWDIPNSETVLGAWGLVCAIVGICVVEGVLKLAGLRKTNAETAKLTAELDTLKGELKRQAAEITALNADVLLKLNSSST
jgi:hypothetical protein